MAAVNPFIFRDDRRGFNTQPPEGGCKLSQNIVNEVIDSFNTQPPEGGCPFTRSVNDFASRFQHTATRRWLLETKTVTFTVGAVSTHSHPKVAANDRRHCGKAPRCFNTQPPEGGCAIDVDELILLISFNTQPPEGGCFF